MGSGKKKGTFKLKEKSLPSWTVNCSVTARNLRKSDLGGVIFGCKHNTIKECFFKQLFGLPAPHYAYVRNIDSGLPLFLFNYSDRKLHGIFEAASTGKMNINRYGWTTDGSDTLYAAQVRIQIKMQCQPLLEDQFRPIIADNYYDSKHFWFELDTSQTEKLISLFSSSPVTPRINISNSSEKWSTSWFSSSPVTPRTNISNSSEKWSTLFNVPCAPNSWQEGDSPKTSKRKMLEAPSINEAAENNQHEVVDMTPISVRSYSSVLRNTTTAVVHSDQSNKGWDFRDGALGLTRESQLLEATITENAVESRKEVAHEHVNWERTYSSVLLSDHSNTGWDSRDDAPGLGSQSQQLEATIGENEVEKYKEVAYEQANHEQTYSSIVHSGHSNRRWGSWDDASDFGSENKLLETTPRENAVENYDVVREQVNHERTYSSVVHSGESGHSNRRWGSWDDASDLDSEDKVLETTINKNAVENYEAVHEKVNREQTYSSVLHSDHSNTGWGSWDDAPDLGSENKLLEATTSKNAVENYEVLHKQVNCERNHSSFVHSDQSNVGWGSWNDVSGLGRESELLEDTISEDAVENYKQVSHELVNDEQTYSSFVKSLYSSLPQKSWSSLFKSESPSIASSEVENFETPESRTPESEVNFTHVDQSKMEWESPHVSSFLDGENQLPKTPIDEEALGKYDENVSVKPKSELLYASVVKETSTYFPQSTSYEDRDFQTSTAVVDSPSIDKNNMDWSSSCLAPYLNGQSQPSRAPSSYGKNAADICEDEHGVHEEECEDFKPSCESTMGSETTSEEHPREYTEVQSADICCSEAMMGSEGKPSGLQTIVAKLVEEVKELKSSQLKQVQKIRFLEQELVESRLEIQKLKDCGKTFESTSELDELVLIVGGFDGSSWLSALDAYSPSSDSVKSLSPMSSVRTYASAAKLNGELYVFGGAHGNSWYDSVESYNPVTDQWISRPSLNRGKGSLAGITLNDKIFAIGGGDGKQSLSEVEMFDLDVGRWIPTRSMLHKRFAPAAAEINGILYVAGGYDGKDYLKSFERLDPREYTWTRLESMTTNRGCHSLVVLNEKLYALGGYNGATMVPTVEVFDPRLGSWRVEEPMIDSRGYSGAVVIRDTIYVIGGLNKNDEILDAVECYKEGHGWQVTNLKALGKRGFFSAII